MSGPSIHWVMICDTIKDNHIDPYWSKVFFVLHIMLALESWLPSHLTLPLLRLRFLSTMTSQALFKLNHCLQTTSIFILITSIRICNKSTIKASKQQKWLRISKTKLRGIGDDCEFVFVCRSHVLMWVVSLRLCVPPWHNMSSIVSLMFCERHVASWSFKTHRRNTWFTCGKSWVELCSSRGLVVCLATQTILLQKQRFPLHASISLPRWLTS